MANEDGSLQLVCNGEIYNAPELREHLQAKGHVFSSGSDNEVILHGYKEWGEGVVGRLEGMFAFVLWDETNKKLFAARDRLGIKPLAMARANGGIALASEITAFHHLRNVVGTLKVAPQALAYYLTLGYVPSPMSIYAGVEKLEAAQSLSWSPGSEPRLHTYWQPPEDVNSSSAADDQAKSLADWSGMFHTTLHQHLQSDVPIGLFLSGGLDSSSIALGLKDRARDLNALTVGYTNSAHDESPIARAVTEQLGYHHSVVPLGVADVLGLLDETMGHFDEPFAFGANLSMIQICKAAAQQFKVVLSGDGGDEVLGGYNWHRQVDGPGRLPGLKALRAGMVSFSRRGLSPPARSFAERVFARRSPLHRHIVRLGLRFLPEQAEALLAPMGVRFTEEDLLAPFERHFVPRLPTRRALQRVDLMNFCADVILPKVDRSSMKFGLEVRVPFLDRRIVEWGISRPDDPRENETGKIILREYIEKELPKSVLDHPKQGFSLRVMDRFDWKEAKRRVLSGSIVEKGWIRKDVGDFVNENSPRGTQGLWLLLSLDVWVKAHLS